MLPFAIRFSAAALALVAAASGCAHAPPSCPATSAIAPAPPRAPEERHVYRFDFTLRSEDVGGPSSTSFSLTLEDFEKGEVLIGSNVALTGPLGAPGVPMPSPRHDVGLKVGALSRTIGNDVLLDVSAEMSSFEPPSTIRKISARGNSLASPGSPALVTTLDDGHARRQLMVTATKLR